MTAQASPAVRAPRSLRVAVVGAGPAGIYTADGLTFEADDVEVDLIERLPSPFGLLRYGVAPDHLTIRSATASLQEVLDRHTVRLFCNVEVGGTVTVQQLRERYDAVVYATGADADRALGILGEDLAGSTSATAIVKWYNGHPEAVPVDLSTTQRAVVVGAGNVALDVTRMLVKDPEAFAEIELHDDVLHAFRASAVTDVHILARRGPEHARFSTKELNELGQLDGIDVIVDPSQLPTELPDKCSPMVRRNLGLLGTWAGSTRTGASRRVHLHFNTSPVAIRGSGAVSSVRVRVAGGDRGAEADMAADLVVRAVGYRSRPIPGIPFSDDTATIPHDDHRVVRDGQPSVGEYAVGWAKRGPTGILGRSRSDADDTVRSILADRQQLLARRPDPGGAADLFASRALTSAAPPDLQHA